MAKNTEAAETAELRAATAHYSEIRTRMHGLEEKLQALELARTLAFTGSTGSMPENLREKAQPYLHLATRRPRAFAARVEETQDEIEKLAPEHKAASERLDIAKRRETNRLAVLLQPKHKEIVQRMMHAVEQLSSAIADENQLLAEFSKSAPLPQSRFLPSVGGVLGTGTLADFDSPLWRWRKHVAGLGIMEK